MNYCRFCGKKLPRAEGRFCPYCGENLIIKAIPYSIETLPSKVLASNAASHDGSFLISVSIERSLGPALSTDDKTRPLLLA